MVDVKMQFRRLAASVIVVGALTSGMLIAGASGAMAAPCGLSYTVGDVPLGPLKVVYYDIRNCHSYTVHRKLDLAGTTDEPCLTIGAGQTVSRTRVVAGWAGVRGIKPC
jgi:hypothetical protein